MQNTENIAAEKCEELMVGLKTDIHVPWIGKIENNCLRRAAMVISFPLVLIVTASINLFRLAGWLLMQIIYLLIAIWWVLGNTIVNIFRSFSSPLNSLVKSMREIWYNPRSTKD